MTADRAENAKSPLIAFAGGGTGGHLYPAIAIAEALCRRVPGVRFAFFGTRRHVDEHILDRLDCEVVKQDLTPLSRFPWRWPGIYLDFRRTSRLCRRRFLTDTPSVVIGTGGLASVPAVREAVRAGIPTAILNPDALPGRANRHLAVRVDAVFAQWPITADHMPTGTELVVCGCPIRSDFNDVDRRAGLERFGLDECRKTLLITGASQGAKSINDSVIANGEFLARLTDWQILHLTGENDRERIGVAYERCGAAATVLAYTDHMAEALAAGDLVISRAGASTLAEITALGRPSILMPYPYHKDQHQLANARCLARTRATQIVVDEIDPDINGPALRCVLEELMFDDELRSSMASAAQDMGRRNAAEEIAGHVLRLAEGRGCKVPD